MVGRLDSAQKMVNQEARLTTGAFRTTNQGALSLESGIRPAAAQLDNRLRRFALRLASLPKATRRGISSEPRTVRWDRGYSRSSAAGTAEEKRSF